MKKGGDRDGEGRKPSAESSSKPRKGSEGSADTPVRSSGETLTLKVIDGGDTVLIGDEKVPMNRLRGFLSTFLPDHPGAKVEVTGNDDIPLKALHNTVDAVRDNGNKNVGIKAE
jgi:biopolymer transport protein ExbD